MKQWLKVLLGIVTLWPLAYMILFFLVIFSTILFTPGPSNSGPPPLIALIFPLHMLTMLVILALMIFYIVDVFKNERVEKDKKALWAVVLFMGNMIAMPVYWYIYIWKTAPTGTTPAPGQLGSAETSAWTGDVKASRSEETEYIPKGPPNWRE
jgi:hypothetical protein